MTVTLGPLPAPGPLPLADSAQPGRPRSWLCCGGGGHLHLLPQGDGGTDTDQYWSPCHHQATLSIPGYTESVETYSLGTVTTCLLSPFVDSFVCSVSGLHNAAYSLGNFTGPTLAGLIYQKVIKDTNPCLRCETMFPRLGSVGAVWSSRS